MPENGLILAVETSSRIGSVALARGDEFLGEKEFSAPLRHSAEIFPAISELLSSFASKPDQIEQVYISGGPGSFTGLRIAATLAKAMHLATAVKIVSVDTLDVVASNVINSFGVLRSGFDRARGTQNAERDRIATIVDAKRGQFFVAVYEKGRSAAPEEWTKTVPDRLMRPEQFIEDVVVSGKDIWLLGDGLLYYKEEFQTNNVHFFDQKYWSPRSSKVYLLGRQMAQTGEFSDPLLLGPNYLRGPDVKVKTK